MNVPTLLALAQDPALRDATPLPRYLAANDVHDVIEGSALELGACVPEGSKDAESHVAFRVEADGAFAGVALSGPLDPAIEACVAAAFGAMRARPHDEVPLVADYTIVIRDGALVPFPVVTLATPDPFPRFWYLPSDVDPATRKKLARDLGLVTTEPGVDSGPARPWTSTAD
jgi:hypothetical protein